MYYSKLYNLLIYNALLLVVCAKRSKWFSSSSLYCKLADDFKLVNRSYVMGSMTQDESDFTLLMATYETPAVLSDFPISIQAFGRVSPWLL